MSKKPKPKWGFTGIAPAIPNPLTRDQIDLIKKESNVDLSDELERELIEAVRAYLSNKEVYENWPRISQMIKALQKIYNNADRLIENLEKLDIASTCTMSLYRNISLDQLEDSYQRFKLYTNDIMEASEKAVKYLNRNKHKIGRPPNVGLNSLIEKLIDIYEASTGEDAKLTRDTISYEYKGPFFNFVDIVLKSIGENLSNLALGKRIYRLLK